MSKKLVLCLALLTMGMGVLGCFPPIYSTAKIEPGWHYDVGVAATLGLWPDGENIVAGMGNFEIRHGFNDYLQMNGRLGLGLAYYSGGDGSLVGSLLIPFLDPALGVQTSLPLGIFTPSLRVELSPFQTVITPALGIGNNERFTLGGRLYFTAEEFCVPGGFLSIHIPETPITIYLAFGIVVFEDAGIVTLGVGYKLK